MIFQKLCVAAAMAVLMTGQALAQTAPEADPGILRQKKTDAVEFKHRLFRLLQGHDRRTANAADIEAAMGGGFLSDPKAASSTIPPAPGKRVASGFRTMAGQQYVVAMAELDPGLPMNLRGATLYGFEMTEFAGYGDNCLTLDDVRYNFRGAYGWQAIGSETGQVGIRGEREEATVIAFIDKAFPMSAKDQAELDRLAAQEKSLDRVERQRFEALKAKINGCVIGLDLF